MKHIQLFIIAAAMLTACQESLEEKAAREAREYTKKNCPAKIDETLYMDSLTFEKATCTFGYHYKLIGMADTIAAIEPERQRKSLVDGIKNATVLRDYKDKGYSFKYSYHSGKSPETVYYETTITAEDYR